MLNQILSNYLLLTLFIIAIALIVIATVVIIIPALSKKGIDVNKYIKSLDAASTAADTIISVADKIMPNNAIINILKIIDCYAKKAVGGSEQLYLASQLPADQRNIKAKEILYAALKTANIEVTPEIDSIVNGAIEAEVLALGHKPIDIKQVQDTNSQLQTQNTQLQSANNELQNTNSQLQQQNQQLQQTITSVQTAITQ